MGCNHKINSKNTSIQIENEFSTMTTPRIYFGFCPFCGKGFKFIKENNKYIQFKEGGIDDYADVQRDL